MSENSGFAVLAIVLAIISVTVAIDLQGSSSQTNNSTLNTPRMQLTNGTFVYVNAPCYHTTTSNNTVFVIQTTGNMTYHISGISTQTITQIGLPFDLQNATTETQTIFSTSSAC